MSQRASNVSAILILAVAIFLAGCEKPPPPPYVAKSITPPAVVYCNDNTGHKAGSKPFVMGGTCCCTPTDELMDQLHKDGYCVGMSTQDLTDEYTKAGIALKSPGHERCNGLCPSGPHVVLGGKCMCPPTPGTQYYEDVVTGKGVVKYQEPAKNK